MKIPFEPQSTPPTQVPRPTSRTQPTYVAVRYQAADRRDLPSALGDGVSDVAAVENTLQLEVIRVVVLELEPHVRLEKALDRE
jgi:hypothetical protein